MTPMHTLRRPEHLRNAHACAHPALYQLLYSIPLLLYPTLSHTSGPGTKAALALPNANWGSKR